MADGDVLLRTTGKRQGARSEVEASTRLSVSVVTVSEANPFTREPNATRISIWRRAWSDEGL
jgi:hypothetical protein